MADSSLLYGGLITDCGDGLIITDWWWTDHYWLWWWTDHYWLMVDWSLLWWWTDHYWLMVDWSLLTVMVDWSLLWWWTDHYWLGWWIDNYWLWRWTDHYWLWRWTYHSWLMVDSSLLTVMKIKVGLGADGPLPVFAFFLRSILNYVIYV